MFRIPMFALVFTFSLLPALALAEEPTAPEAELLEVSGVNEGIRQVASSISQSFGALASSLDEDERLEWQQDIDQAFADWQAQHDVAAEIRENMSPREIAELVRWFQSDLGSKVVQLELQALSDAGQAELASDFDALSRRKDLLKRAEKLNRVIAATDRNTILQRGALRHMYIQYGDVPVAEEEIDRLIEDTIQSTQKDLREMVMTSLAYVYQPLSDREFRRYVKFQKRTSTGAYRKLMESTFDDAFLSCLEAAVDSVAARKMPTGEGKVALLTPEQLLASASS